jgi:hypothetical protein
MMAAQDVNIKLKAVDDTKAAFTSVDRSLGGLKSAVFSVQAAIAGVVSGATVGVLISANKSFQNLEASLITFTGSTEKAAQAFEALSQFAATTPFGLEEVVGGFNKLIARGIAPTIAQLTSFGNIASGTGKSLDQFIEAIADASVGEFERLKEFGIKANAEGNTVKLTFAGVTTSIGRDSQSMINYLTQLGDTKFAGGMERQANTIGGAFSSLADSISLLAIEVGKSGFNDWLVESTKNLTSFIARISDAKKASLDFIQGLEVASKVAALGEEGAIKAYTEELDFLKSKLEGAIFTEGLTKEIESVTMKLALLKGELKKGADLPEMEIVAQKIQQQLKTVDDYATRVSATVGNLINSSDLAMQQEQLAQLEMLDKMYFELGLSAEYYQSALKKLFNITKTQAPDANEALLGYARAAKDVGASLVNLQVGAIRSLEDSFVGLINGTMSVRDAFSSMATSIINDLIRIMIQQSITGPIAQALGFSNPFNSGSQFQAGSANFVGPMPATGKAIGGSVQSGQQYLVGERGPEMFIPNQSGSIVPNSDMGGSGVVVNQTINVTTGVQQTVRAEIMSLMPQISNAAKAAVADAKLRGGSYGKMMA